MILRLLNWQGIAGIAASIALLGLLIAQRLDASHWHKQSDRFEKLYDDEQLAVAKTTAAYRQAADTARIEDRANVARVAAEQRTINERTEDEYEKRLASARAAAARLVAGRLRGQSSAGAADPGDRGAAAVPRLPASSGSPAQAAGDHGLPAGDPGGDAALTATEQAIQLDELITWVKRQASVDPTNASAPAPVHP